MSRLPRKNANIYILQKSPEYLNEGTNQGGNLDKWAITKYLTIGPSYILILNLRVLLEHRFFYPVIKYATRRAGPGFYFQVRWLHQRQDIKLYSKYVIDFDKLWPGPTRPWPSYVRHVVAGMLTFLRIVSESSWSYMQPNIAWTKSALF